MEPMSDVEMDKNCDTSNLQPESGIEGEKNCDFSNRSVMIKISKKEKTLADLHLKNHEIIVKSEFQVERTNTEPMSDDEIDENCDTSNIIKTSDHDEEDVSEYEKLRLKNIAERQAKFNELKIKDKVLDLSKNNKIKKRKVTKEKLAAVKRPILARKSKAKGRHIKIKKSVNKAEKGSLCDLCNKSFKSSHELRVHVSLKHPLTQSFECHLCQKVCGSQTGLDSHVTTHYLRLDFTFG